MERLLRAALRWLPARRRALGEALLAEAAAVAQGRRRTVWLLGGFLFVIREGIAMTMHRRSVAWTALIVGVVGLGVAVEIVLSNVVFPTTGDDDTTTILLAYLCLFAAFFLVGYVVARDGVGAKGQLLAGAAAGVTIGLLSAATFAVVDNVWLDIVARQQPKIVGFAESGAWSMRAYINSGLIGAAIALPIMLGIVGALVALAGGLARQVRARR
jgi:hypothetical protein